MPSLTQCDHPHIKKPKANTTIPSLDSCLVGDWNNGLWRVLLHRNGSGISWLSWLSLKVDGDALGLSLPSLLGVLLDSAKELLS